MERVLDPAPALAAIALGVALAAGVAIVWVWLSTRPRPIEAGPATMDLRDETPALVDLLVGGFQVEDDAVPATAVDLAARGFYDFEEYGGDLVIRLRDRPGARVDELAAYEQRVLRHVREHAVDGITPATVLTIGADGVSERWFKGFVREVTKDGRHRGLCSQRYDLRHLVLIACLVAAGAAPGWLVAATADRIDEPTGWGSIGNLLLGMSMLIGVGLVGLAGRVIRSDSQGDTEAGRAVAAHWLGVRDLYRSTGRFEDKPAASVAVWDRHLAYATAMGLAPEVQRQLPFETEHDRHAWSRVTGSWRRVKVRYRSLRPGWGSHPGRVAFEGLVRGAVFGFVAYLALVVSRSDDLLVTLEAEQRGWVSLGAIVVASIAAVAAVYGLVRVIVGLADLVPRRTVEGEVVRSRRYRSGHRLPKVLQWMIWSGRDEHGMRRDQRRRTRCHVAIDDGSDDSILAYTVGADIHRRAPQGSRVRARVSPILGYVADLEMIEPPVGSAASAPLSAHPLVDETTGRVVGAIGSRVGEAVARAESMTDDEGRPILDQRDDDGVTLRDRLDESRDQLERARQDPRIRNSPLAGLLDALAADPDRPDDD